MVKENYCSSQYDKSLRTKNIIAIFATITLALLLIVRMCRYPFNEEYNFGNNYVLYDDGEVFYIDTSRNNSLFTIIPYGVIKYNSDKRWIVAKTVTKYGFRRTQEDDSYWLDKNGVSDYWIIDKLVKINTRDTSNFSYIYNYPYEPYYTYSSSVIGPIDSTSFLKEKDRLDIKLRLKKKKIKEFIDIFF